LPEFGSRNLETLRQPLEDRVVTISRANGTLSFPAAFTGVFYIRARGHLLEYHVKDAPHYC
jgi:predicted ATPase with chaperone activity